MVFLDNYSNWMRRNFIVGTFIYIIVFILIQPTLFPPNIFILLGAFTYAHSLGFVRGLFLTWWVGNVCQFIGGLIIFFGARYLFRKRI